ncbi:hypothetical protein B0H15DRAFT_813835 [Mycena belliarum]|uniref:Uncharacterized protein n=1 Tax=Mycena belliarum TaxID=1033014 RepID=A0AAD6UFX4_9AGAR|nr:hypothetical protein B0H15DRAFT_813835 [Mycena belliae]
MMAAKKAAKKRKKSHEAASLPSRSASSSSVPRVTTHKSVPQYSAPIASSSTLPKKKTIVISDSSDSDDDRPLANSKRKMTPKAPIAESSMMLRSESQDKDNMNVSANRAKYKESSDKAKSVPPSRPPTPPVTSLFSPSPPSSPEITLSSLKVQSSSVNNNAKKVAAPKTKGVNKPSLSVNTDKAAPSGSFPSATKSTSGTVPKPLPSRRKTASNAGSAASSTFPSRPFGKTTTSTILSASKPSTPTTPSASTPTISFPKTATPTVPPSAIPAHINRHGSGSSRGVQFSNTPDPSSAGSGSGLSTKQRLSQSALTLAPAKDMAKKKSNLSGLNFKKNAPSSTPNLPTASGSSHQAKNPPLPKRKTVDPLFDPEPDLPTASGSSHQAKNLPLPKRKTVVPLFDPEPDDEPFGQFDAPLDMDLEPDERPSILPPALSRRPNKAETIAQTDLRSPLPPSPPPQASLSAQADSFLKEIIPVTSTPLSASAEKQDVPGPSRSLGLKTKMPPPKIPKKWKWTGKLLVDLADRTDHFCDVVINDLVPPLIDGLRISDAVASVESLRLLSFHDLVDMSHFIKTCLSIQTTPPPQQLARLGPASEKDTEPLKTMARYMTKKSFVSLVPAFQNGNLEGHILLFPPVMKILIQIFHVPSELANNSSLIAAILPWKVFPEESRRSFSINPPRSTSPSPSMADWKKTMRNSKYQLGLRVLKFPTWLHEWMSKTNRPYCIWPPSGDQAATGDLETQYLIAILTQCGAKKVSFKTDIRAIFVHVGSLKHIRKLPLLAGRRSQTCSIRFYTYGTHETIHPEHWGIREIYPFGGVVTFTPNALYEDPWGVIGTMKAVNKHPLWTCYILPSVLGMATKLSSPEEDPLAAFDKGTFVFELLLRAIDAGEVSLVRAPPLDRSARKESDSIADWLRDHWIARPLGPRRILEFCVDDFSAKYSNVSQEQWTSAVETEIANDLDLMQQQPEIMKHHRRYVIIRAESDSSVIAEADGFERVTNSNFTFNDAFPKAPPCPTLQSS